jgi:hypothetical protein
MINRQRFRPPYGGTHISSVSAGSESQLGAAGPVVGAFIAGPIGALIGRVLAGTIEAVTSSKPASASPKKKRPGKKASQVSEPSSQAAKPSGPLASKAEAATDKPPRKRRTKKP